MKITKLDVSYASGVDLSKYTTIIANGGALDKTLEAKLKTWVQNGGTLIGNRGATRWMASKKFMSLSFNEKTPVKAPVSFENRSLQSGAQVIGGAIFNTKLDRSHPINFGYKNDYLPMFRNTTIFVKPNKRSYNNPIQYTNNPLLAGYISEENLAQLKNTVPFQVQRSGRGRAIIFTDNSNFRAFWYGTNKLLMNAVFFSNMM